MQPTLKDIGVMSSLPGMSVLAQSALWRKPVNSIQPVQLHAFVRRHADLNQRDVAQSAVQICLDEVRAAVKRREIEPCSMLDYSAPHDTRISMTDFENGLLYMGAERTAAVLFALETDMTAFDVGRLTWRTAIQLFNAATLSEVAIASTRICPRQLRLQYVFWQERTSDGMPAPLFSLDKDVFDAFGLVWAELVYAYSRL